MRGTGFRFLRTILLGIALVVVHYLPERAEGGAFDRVGVGARPKGMGDAFTAIGDDANSVYWNPAGIAQIEKSQLSVMHKDLFGLGLVNYEFLGYVHPNVGKGSLGFSWIRLDTTRHVEFMDYSENTYIISYGVRIVPSLSFGGNIKYYSVDYEKGGSGFGADIGILYKTFDGHLNLGFLYQDFNGTKIRWETLAEDKLPANLRLGLGFRPSPYLNLALDLNKLLESYVETHLGIEWWILKRGIGLRTGLINQDKGGWNFAMGGSFGYRFLRFDYAWERHYDLGGTHLFSLVITF